MYGMDGLIKKNIRRELNHPKNEKKNGWMDGLDGLDGWMDGFKKKHPAGIEPRKNIYIKMKNVKKTKKMKKTICMKTPYLKNKHN